MGIFSGRKQLEATAELRRQVTTLRATIETLQRQVAALSRGILVPAAAIVDGVAIPEIPSGDLLRFIEQTPNVLLLDVRNDTRWDARHIAGAKHLPVGQLLARLGEMPDRGQPILVLSEQGNEAIVAAEQLSDAGYQHLFVAAGGMAAYTGPVVESAIRPIDPTQVTGIDRALIAKVAALLDRDVRPGLQRDGGDLQLVAVESGIVRVRMVGACHGCGAQTKTVQQGMRTYLMHTFPEITGIEQV